MGILDAVTGNNNEKDTFAAAPTPERLRKSERVLIITADKTQDLEFFYPYYRLSEEGYQVDVATISGGKFEGKQGMGLKQTKSIDEVRGEDYALLYIPGGKAPEELRKNEKVLNLVREFARSGRPIAAICHGAQVLISAGLAQGKRMAAWPDVRGELQQAGGTFVDEALVEDGQFITARQPGDLPRHLWGVLDILQGEAGSRRALSGKKSAA